jgi:hypothetical protein
VPCAPRCAARASHLRSFAAQGYLLAVIQHPYGDSDNAYGALPTSSGVAGYVGYVGPIPTTKAAALAAGTSSGASSVAVSVSLLLALLALLV